MKRRSEDEYEEFIFPLGNADKSIIKTTTMMFNIHNVYLDGEIGEVYKYRDLCYLLDMADDNSEVIFHINSVGGNLNSTCQILNSIRNTNATTKAVIHNECASAASLIALSVEELYLTPFSSLLAHAGSYGYGGFTGRMDSAVTHINAGIRAIMEDVYQGFLTPDELEQLDDGKEFWMNADQIQERLDRRHEYFQSMFEDEQKKLLEEAEVEEEAPPPKRTRRKKNAED